MSLVPAREIPNSSIRIILIRIVDGHKPILDLLFLSNVWFEEGSLLDHVGDGVVQFFLPRHGLGHAEIDPSSNWIIDRQEPP